VTVDDQPADRLGKDYTCPQCGPDPRGEAEHAKWQHTWPPGGDGDDSTEATVDDFAAFMAARYDEAEALAQQAGGDEWADNGDVVSAALAKGDYGPRGYWVAAASFACESEWEPLHEGHAEFIAANDPAHRLADIKLKRAILAEHAHCAAASWPDRTVPRGFGCSICHWHPDYGQLDDGWCATVRQLGTEFASHPGYKESWKP
jgi:hypothetical protein